MDGPVTAPSDPSLFARIEAFYDAVPRDRGRAEAHGPLVLFVSRFPTMRLYARPALGEGAPPTVEDIAAVRARQRVLGAPEAFEWVHETTPALLPAAEAAGLSVMRAPLMVLDPAALPAAPALEEADAAAVRFLDPDSPSFAGDLATYRAVANLGFGAPGTAAGDAGPAARDAALAPAEDAEAIRELVRAGAADYALAVSPAEGALAGGAFQRAGTVVEIVGVATLPSARRRGLGAAITAALARRALEQGAGLVILSAGGEDVARMYSRVGFRRIGTACIAQAPA